MVYVTIPRKFFLQRSIIINTHKIIIGKTKEE